MMPAYHYAKDWEKVVNGKQNYGGQCPPNIVAVLLLRFAASFFKR
jgi:hypothetical protein